MKVCIIGSGYVGLVTGACLADMENDVVCLDIDINKVESLRAGLIPIYEPDLENLVNKNIRNGFLKFESLYENVTDAEVFFICVDTPNDKNQQPNLKNLHSVCESLCNSLTKNAIIVLKSTVPLGTNHSVANIFNAKLPKNISVDIVSNPEFLREGSAVNDFMRPERIIIGSNSNHSIEVLNELYRPFSRKSDKLIIMSPASAELSKYAANAFLATKISFVNEMALIAEKIDANMHEVREGLGSDSRIGDQFLYAGLGYGGSCFPKDLDALISFQSDNNIQSNILKAAHTQNRAMENFFFTKIMDCFDDPSKTRLLFWGTSFKPNTDDIRESIAIKLIARFVDKFHSIGVYDPKALEKSKVELEKYNNLVFLKDKYDAIETYDALIICTEWKEFWNPDFKKLKKIRSKIILDGRNILDKHQVIENELTYIGIGT